MDSLKKLFLEKVEQTPTCWLWVAAKRSNKKDSYGSLKFGGKVIDAHRVSYMLFKGEIPDGMQVCHSCDVRLCVNPDHLWLGTSSDNMIDCVKKGRLRRSEGKKFVLGHKPVTRSLTEAKAKEIKQLLQSGDKKIEEIASMYNVKRNVIADISSGRTYSTV